MARENNPFTSIIRLSESARLRITWFLGLTALCSLFYFLGSWQSAKSGLSPSKWSDGVKCREALPLPSNAFDLDFQSRHPVASLNASSPARENFPPCDFELFEYTPCQDSRKARKLDRTMMKYRERHCPRAGELLRCLVPAPPDYKNPFRWPESRDHAWVDNIPHKELSVAKAVQNWIQVEGNRFRFPGGGTMFPRGADAYIDDINSLVSLTNGSIRTALDTGCGVRQLSDILIVPRLMRIELPLGI